MADARISAVINTMNEERNLAYALRSVRAWVDEIVVVDMHSDDRTVEIARSFGAIVSTHARTGFVEPARADAIARATGEWILVLDADELIPAPLARVLKEMAHADRADVVAISRVNYLHGYPIRRAGWQPEKDRHFRFFKRGMLHATETIHAPLVPAADARIMILPYAEGQAIIHFNFVDFADLLGKVNRYTTIEARQAYTRGARARWWSAARAVVPFWQRFIRDGGYREGWRGWYLSLIMASYELQKCAKLREHAATGGYEAIAQRQAAEAERWLAAHEGRKPPSPAAAREG